MAFQIHHSFLPVEKVFPNSAALCPKVLTFIFKNLLKLRFNTCQNKILNMRPF